MSDVFDIDDCDDVLIVIPSSFCVSISSAVLINLLRFEVEVPASEGEEFMIELRSILYIVMLYRTYNVDTRVAIPIATYTLLLHSVIEFFAYNRHSRKDRLIDATHSCSIAYQCYRLTYR
jgi:hypothetical protein